MDFMLPFEPKKLDPPVRYSDSILLVGSCFTEHIGNTLQDLKFNILQNPHGILFDPASVHKSLLAYIDNKTYTKADLFLLNGIWQSWEHHSRFADVNAEAALMKMNTAVNTAHHFLKSAKWLIITLGSSYSYRLTGIADGINESPVANCHRAPAQWFTKHLQSIDETVTQLDTCYHRLRNLNPDLKIIFTISPVRHIRDGVVENNRSKARLLEAVHHMVDKFDQLYYFPAYELVIDVLRDHRFYDVDLVHPNYMATEYVLDKFAMACIHPADQLLMQEIKKIIIARKHRSFHPTTEAHRQFLASYYERTRLLQEKYPDLDFSEEISYFNALG